MIPHLNVNTSVSKQDSLTDTYVSVYGHFMCKINVKKHMLLNTTVLFLHIKHCTVETQWKGCSRCSQLEAVLCLLGFIYCFILKRKAEWNHDRCFFWRHLIPSPVLQPILPAVRSQCFCVSVTMKDTKNWWWTTNVIRVHLCGNKSGWEIKMRFI